ncbi:MAG TPA: hypothetical protein VLX68_09340 [Chitinivibrionales bacterium]|nr:hypothetical protein [Chitinivibrionales bacterium]
MDEAVREIVKVDKQYRKKLFTAYLLGIAVISLTVGLGWGPLMHFMKTAYFAPLMNVSEALVMFVLFCVIGPSIFLIFIGRRIMTSRRMPYPGQKVIHDTVVITGKKAVMRGRMLFILGISAIIISIAGAARSHYIFEKMRHFNPIAEWNKSKV